jgi:hypothetical protein
MPIGFPLIQLFRIIISQLFQQIFFELITIEPIVLLRYTLF